MQVFIVCIDLSFQVGHPGQELPHDQQIRMQQVRAHHIHQVQARNQLRAMSLPHGARPPVSVQQETRQTVYHQMPHTSQPHGSYSQVSLPFFLYNYSLY